MRKLGYQAQIERKRRTTTIIASIVMLLILVVSTAGYALLYNPSPPSQSTSEEYSITQVNGQWRVVLSGNEFYLLNSPQQVSDIPIEISSTINLFNSKTLYIDSQNPTIFNEIASNLGKFSSRVQEVCLGECERDLPEKDCSENLIVYIETEQNKVYQENNCIFIEGDIKSADALIYKLLGIN